MEWTPEDPRDTAVAAAFDRHQGGDKGLGPALGPAAVDRSARLLEAAGFTVETAPSPWSLGSDQVPLQRALVDGIAAAAAEAGAEDAAAWGTRRQELAPRTHCTIGHLDLLAIPGGHPHETPHAPR